MQSDLSRHFEFVVERDAEWRRFHTANGQITFLLRENPTQIILHTRQVEYNGLLHSLLLGTPLENKGYEYFGAPTYADLIEPAP